MLLLRLIARGLPRSLVAVVVLALAVAPALAQSEVPASHAAAVQLLDAPEWAVTVGTATLRSQPDMSGEAFGELRPLAPLQILGYDEDWAYVFNPRTKGTAFVPADAVAFTAAPTVPVASASLAAPVRSFAGRWIDVDLSLPARLTAYQGGTPVRSMLTIIGRGPLATPTGTFSIIRRVANEMMDSSTVGIPRNSPGGYYLTNVLYTQYFLPGGQSIHYNWWSSNFGYPGSHGCLGLSYGDAAYMWNFATLGTPVSIHY